VISHLGQGFFSTPEKLGQKRRAERSLYSQVEDDFLQNLGLRNLHCLPRKGEEKCKTTKTTTTTTTKITKTTTTAKDLPALLPYGIVSDILS